MPSVEPDDSILAILDDVNITDRNGRTPIFYAIISSRNGLVSKLISRGAYVAIQDSEGRTPLHFAVETRNTEVGRILLESGAEVDAKDIHGNTPLWGAVMQFRDFEDMIKLLLAHGASPSEKNIYDKSPMVLAMSQKGQPVLRLLEAEKN